MNNVGAILVLIVAVFIIGELGLFGIILVAGAALIGWYTTSQNKKPQKRTPAAKKGTRNKPLATAGKAQQQEPKRIEVGTPEDIERAWARGDYNQARRWLQKIAYGMVEKHVTDRERQEFKQIVKSFAVEDPLYYELLGMIRPAIANAPGVLQSKLTKEIQGYSVEHIRYVLYFAHELGDIHRVKHGRTYKLYLPGTTLEGELVGN